MAAETQINTIIACLIIYIIILQKTKLDYTKWPKSKPFLATYYFFHPTFNYNIIKTW